MRNYIAIIFIVGLSSSLASPAILGTEVSDKNLPLCYKYKCKLLSKTIEKSGYGNVLFNTYQLLKFDAKVELGSMEWGYLLGITLKIPRYPLNVKDEELTINTLNSALGRIYDIEVVRKCLDKSMVSHEEELLLADHNYGGKCKVYPYFNSYASWISFFIGE